MSNPGNKPTGYYVVNRNTGIGTSSFHGPNAFERACASADEHPDTGYLSVCAMVGGIIESANLRGIGAKS